MSKKPMKGSAPDPAYPLRFPLLASIKYDGIRLMMDGREPRTNSMKTLPNKHTVAKLQASPGLADCDMELIWGDPADPLCYNKTFRAVMTIEGQPDDVDFYIFDLVKPGVPYSQRLAELAKRFEDGLMPPNAKLVTQHVIKNQAELNVMYAQVTAAGHEGLIVRSLDGDYKFGRATAKSQDLLKLKPEEDSEFAILGFYEALENTNEAFVNGLGNLERAKLSEGLVPKGLLGGFLARDIHTGQEFRCAPGKLSHRERVEIFENQTAFSDRIGKYRHFPVGALPGGAPRHPRWIGWRAKEDLDESGRCATGGQLSLFDGC